MRPRLPNPWKSRIGWRLPLRLLAIVLCWSAARAMHAEPAAESATPEAIDFFEKSVRPLLASKCSECHGAETQEANLRVDSRDSLLVGGDSGPVVSPGETEQSLLIAAVRQSGELKMPPDDKLTDEEIAALEHWVRLGAPWPASDGGVVAMREEVQRAHWAFQPIGNPDVPKSQNAEWVRTPVDAFVLGRLRSQGLTPSPQADKRTLIRRVTYDLTGLPPTPEEVANFVADESPDAYARLVERLLDSPHYGEHWARHWLDLARYSDSKGYVYAREERMFVHSPAYRDWVVRAFNDDMPYNRFLLLQIAADQLAADDRASLAAMGFLTGGRRFLGVTHDIIDDRIDVVTRTALGLSVACARCHDHKYDPIPTEDYYSLYGVFLNCTERLVPIAESTAAEPERAAFAKELAARQQALAEKMATGRAELSQITRGRVADYLLAQRELEKHPEEIFNQIVYKEDVIAAFVRRWENYLAAAARADDSIFRPWRLFVALPDSSFVQQAADVTRQLHEASSSPLNPLVAKAFETPPNSIRDVAERYEKLLEDIDAKWQELVKSASEPPSALPDVAAEQLRGVLYGPHAPCEVPDEPILSNELYFDTATIEALWKLHGDVDRWLLESPAAPPQALMLVDRVSLQEPRVFRRGNPHAKGNVVPRRFLKLLSGPERTPFSHGSGRLELARAIIDPDNPLTARVWANRIWTQHFGEGLVRTPSDFGLRAQAPSHSELLDWLARQLLTNGWSTKALHRAIVLSSTYQQSSSGSADEVAAARAQEIDPENRLLWRMNRRRLTFEQWRDSMLAASNELELHLGGRGTDLFASDPDHRRRTLYGFVDRQFLPNTLRMFDFANPDLHIAARSETTVSQQALFSLNNPIVANRARACLAALDESHIKDPGDRVRWLYQRAYQRDPTDAQLAAAIDFLSAPAEPEAEVRPEVHDWLYGYGEFTEDGAKVSFTPLSHFTGSAWQGGGAWPDEELGWVQLTSEGGHPGNDLAHAAIRRWRAPHRGKVAIRSTVAHAESAGDGIRCRVVSSRHGLLMSATVHNRQASFEMSAIEVEVGDKLDFIADINGNLHSDQHLWKIEVVEQPAAASNEAKPASSAGWNSSRDFSGPVPKYLTPWQQFAQVLLLSNEMMFVD